MKTLALFLALLFPAPCFAQATHDHSDHATANGGGSGSVSSVSIASFTIASNANRYLICGTVGWDGSGGQHTQTLTWNNGGAVSLSKIFSTTGSFGIYSDVWELLNPLAGTSSITATDSDGTFFTYGLACTSAYNINQISPRGTPSTAEVNDFTNPNPTLSVASAVGDLVIDFVNYNQDTLPTLTVGGGQTERTNAVIDAGFAILSSTEPGGAGTTSMDWTASGGSGSGEWIDYGVALKAATSTARVPHRVVQ